MSPQVLEKVKTNTKPAEPSTVSLISLLQWIFATIAIITLVVISMVTAIDWATESVAGIPPLIPNSCPNYSPTFPSEGGPDCATKCGPGRRSVGTAFFNIFPASYDEKISEVAELVVNFAPDAVTYTEGSKGFMDSHISFSYYCCQTEDELSTIKTVLENVTWVPRAVNFSYATCAIDGPTMDHVSFIVMLEEESNQEMLTWVEEVEDKIAAKGVVLNSVRRNQEPYHSTLAVVSGSRYPVAKAISAINHQFPPGEWLEEKLVLTKPCGAHGNTTAGFFC